MEKERNLQIDILRAYAVLCVWILHCCLMISHTFNISIPIKDYVNLEVGVDLFFVISGFVVCDSLYKSKMKNPDFSFIDFIAKRLKRLWFTAVFWLGFCLIFGMLLQGINDWPSLDVLLRQFLSGLVYIYNFQEFCNPTALGYFWSLSVEFQFYLFLPLLFSFQRKYRVIYIVYFFLMGIFYRPGGETWWMFRYDGLLVGIFIWEYRDFVKKILNIGLSYALLKALCLMFFGIFLVIEVNINDAFLAKVIASIFAGLVVCFAITEKNLIPTFKCERMLNWLGLRSYSIYLCHIPINLILLSFFEIFELSNLISFIMLSLVLVLVSADFSYRYLEKNKWLNEIFLGYLLHVNLRKFLYR